MIKTFIYRIILHSGLLRLWIYKNRKTINILMLHGVMDKTIDDSWYPFWNRISPDFLASRLEYLSRYYQFIGIDEATEMLSGDRPIRPNCMVLTFDDGYRNNLKYAMPVLRKFNAPATIYLATGYVGGQRPFQVDRLDYAIQSTDLVNHRFRINDTIFKYDTRSRATLTGSYRRHRALIQSSSENEQDYRNKLVSLALELEDESGQSIFDNFNNDDWVNILTWDDIRSYKYNDVEFEGHTVNHYRLALLDDNHVLDELRTSKNDIEEKLGRKCKHLCYPVGSYNQSVINIAESCGYKSAVTTNEGLNAVGCDLLRLYRIPFPSSGDIVSNVIFMSGLGFCISSFIRRLRGASGTWQLHK
ncbi:MAG TPA: hypothetical protein ENI64_08780 [Gammaproteobacteria bacterium]|nr:hypothetical protein [Gammaproteobacteria bacterium]